MALSQHIEFHSLNDEPIAVIKIGRARILQGYQKIIHYINVSAIQDTILTVQNDIHKVNTSNTEFMRIIDGKLNYLKNNIQQLKSRRRLKRWDALGRAWKWMSGSPDADDLKLISNRLNDIADNNNLQININDQMAKNLDNLTETITDIILARDEEKEENLLLIIILNLDTITNEVAAIQEAITLAKLGVINYKLLTLDEVTMINDHIASQGIHPDVLEEALNMASVTVGADGEVLVYIINLPIFSDETYEDLRIETVFRNSLRIQLKGNRYLKREGKLFLVTGTCKNFGNWSLCDHTDLEDLSDDRCIPMILKGLQSNCTYEAYAKHPLVIEINPTTIMLNDVNTTIHTTCGISDRCLIGSFLIIYQNCSITIDKQRYVNEVIGVVNQRLFIPSTGLMVTKGTVEHKIDVHTIHQNLKRLEHLRSTSETHGWSLLGGFSISTTTVACIIIFMMIKHRHQSPIVNISGVDKNQSSENVATPRKILYYIPSSTRQAV